MSFQLIALPAERFVHLASSSAEELERLGAYRMIAAEKPGYPCRVSLADAEVGEKAKPGCFNCRLVRA